MADGTKSAQERAELIAMGHEIATLLEQRGVLMPDAGVVLAIALAILAETYGGPTDGDLRVLVDGQVTAAQHVFHQLRAARLRGDFGHG